MHYTTHGTNSVTSHPKDEAMVKCLASKDTSVTAGDSNSHSADSFRALIERGIINILSNIHYLVNKQAYIF